jgi:hypothetical protein
MVGSDTLVRAWLEGDWTVVEGGYFNCWRYDLHVVEPFEVLAHPARQFLAHPSADRPGHGRAPCDRATP